MSARPRHSEPALFPEALAGDRVGTRRALAEALGLSERHVGRLVTEGVIPPKERGGWSVAECRAALDDRASDDRADAARLLAERIRWTREQADELAMRNARTRAELVSVPEASAAVLAATKHVERRLRALPRRAAPMLVGVDSVPAMQASLGEVVRETLLDLAATTTLPIGAISRKRKRA